MASLLHLIQSFFDAISKSRYNTIEFKMGMSKTCKKQYKDIGKLTALVYLTKGPKGYVINQFEIDKRTHKDLMKRKCYYDMADAEYCRLLLLESDPNKDHNKGIGEFSRKALNQYLDAKELKEDFISGLSNSD